MGSWKLQFVGFQGTLRWPLANCHISPLAIGKKPFWPRSSWLLAICQQGFKNSILYKFSKTWHIYNFGLVVLLVKPYIKSMYRNRLNKSQVTVSNDTKRNLSFLGMILSVRSGICNYKTKTKVLTYYHANNLESLCFLLQATFPHLPPNHKK